MRGTIIDRDGKVPVGADETLVVLRTLDPSHRDLAYAVFGLLTSSTYSFLFSLFSTNAHVSLKELLRMPVPVWTPDLEAQLATATRSALAAVKDLEAHEGQYGTTADRRSIAAATSLTTIGCRGEAVLAGPANRTLGALRSGGQLTVTTGQGVVADEAIRQVISAHESLVYARTGKDAVVPHPAEAAAFGMALAGAARERLARRETVEKAHRRLDDLVMDAYGMIQPAGRTLIAAGVPWARD